MKDSRIEWTHHTFNPWWGCQKVSPGCAHCYAETLAKRWGKDLWSPGAPRRRMSDAYWREPIKWNRDAYEAGTRQRVFCASMCDVFEDNASPVIDEGRFALWTLIALTPHLDWLLLTKRPENIRRTVPRNWFTFQWPANVWVGTTVENEAAKTRISHLLDLPASVLFLSCEPLLGPLGLYHALSPRGVNWVICGGESGAHARSIDPAWVRDLREQCLAAGVPFFFKQWGGLTPKANGRTLDGREWSEYPEVGA